MLPSQGRVPAIRQHIDAVGADLWVLTETHEFLVPCDGWNLVTSGEPDRAGSAGERWVSISSPYPIQSLGEFVSDAARCAAGRLEQPGVGEVIIFACVLPWLGSSWRDFPASGMHAFRAALTLNLLDWGRLIHAFPDAMFVLAGDFNQSLIDRHYYGSRRQQSLLQHLLDDLGFVVATGGSGDPIARDSAPYACIDHICIAAPGGVEITNVRRWPEAPRPDRRLSDHFGVAVDVVRS